jgi:hypothetical protein
MTSFIYKNCTVGEVTGISDLGFRRRMQRNNAFGRLGYHPAGRDVGGRFLLSTW